MPKILQALLCQNLLCQNKRKKSKESLNIEESEDCEEDQSSGSQTIKVNKDTERLKITIMKLEWTMIKMNVMYTNMMTSKSILV